MKEENNEMRKELAKEVYADIGHPIAVPTGELGGLIPRAIKAALAPLEKWILQREYNVAETKKLLEERLKNIPANLIESPEAYIAVPAMIYISYCMEDTVLRSMYANLLANSMVNVVKNGVHPSFVEIIKQLCPDEAKILQYMDEHALPTVNLLYERVNGEVRYIFKNFSNVGELAKCEHDTPTDIAKYFDNLFRLGLIEKAENRDSLSDKALYESLKKNKYVLQAFDDAIAQKEGFARATIEEGYVALSNFGEAFRTICLGPVKIDTIAQSS